MRSWKRRERTQSRGEGRRAPCLHRPRAGGRLGDRQASSQMQGRGSPAWLIPHPRVSQAGTSIIRQRSRRVWDRVTRENYSPSKAEACSRFKKLQTHLPGDGRVTSVGGRGTSEEIPGRQHAQQHAGPQNPNSSKAKVWRPSTTNISEQRLSKAYTASQVKSYPTRADHSAASQ